MFSMCGLLCRFLRGWRQSEAVGLMVHAASLRDASLVVETIETASKSLQDEESHSLFCQPFCKTETRRQQLLWHDNNKQSTLVMPKEKVDLARWTLFLSSSSSNKEECFPDAASFRSSTTPVATPVSSSPASSRKNSACSECENVITVLLEASYREKEEESLYGYHVMVEQLAEPYAWKARDVFGVIIHTTPTKLVSMIHAFFNNALIIDDNLSIRKILTVDLVGEPSTLRDPSTISDCVTPGPWSHSGNLYTQMELARATNIVSPGPDEDMSNSNPNLSRVGSPFSSRLPLSSSFTSSPFRRPIGAGTPSGISPIKKGLTNQGKSSITSPGNDSCPASPLVEEEEEAEFSREVEEEEEAMEENEPSPNILVYTGNNQDYFEDVKETLISSFGRNRYVIYHLTDELAFKSPWKSSTTLLVVCGDVATHVSTVFVRYLLSGGKVLSICSDFLNVAVPLFGTVEVQEAAIVSMSYNRWKNVQLLHHQHCFHSSPKHKRFSKDLEKKASSSGSAVSVEPTFVEITDEYGVRHRLDLTVLAKDDTWGAPSLLVANVNEGNGKALFSQVHLEKDPNKSISLNLRGDQLKRCNESRLEILRDLLCSQLGLNASKDLREEKESLPAITSAYLLGKYEAKQKFFDEMKPYLNEGRLVRPLVTLQIQDSREEPLPSEKLLPILMTGYPSNFSTVKYFEELRTTTIGRLIIYSEVVTSTTDILVGNPPLDNGVVVIATQQLRAKGRRRNTWLSPVGCTMFSLQLHFPVASNMGQRLPFLQHLVALAIVMGVKGISGYETIPLALKWPNDIYLGGKTKIGGVLVEASTQIETVIVNVGCGVNLWNSMPTSCINDAIREHNDAQGTRLPELQRETFCANIFNQMERLLDEFQTRGSDRVIAEYYNHWLHSNVCVSVQNESGQLETATIVGIDSFGFLVAHLTSGETVVLHPDGNSFNMLEGLIYTKL